ncbi:MAG: cation transporting ATPase C-terminal domain-containing protein, partial [Planctomycetales bacterium]|nr:cation transporting ATPase C-terminal domain-containing protein [Planctomycetales bacterium]
DSLFRVGLLSNKAMLGSVLLTFGLQMMVVYLPPLQDVFHTAPLSLWELGVCLLLSTVVFWAVELQKLWLRRYHKPHETQRNR